MKKPTILNLDIEIVEALEKQDNRSRFVNDLLKEFFGEGGDLKRKELEAKIAEKEREIKQTQETLINLQKSLLVITEKEDKIKSKFINIPKAVLNDFVKFPAMNEESLRNRYNTYWKVYTCPFSEILEAFKEFKNGE